MVLGRRRVQDQPHQAGWESIWGVRKKAKGPPDEVPEHHVLAPDSALAESGRHQGSPEPEPDKIGTENGHEGRRRSSPGCEGAETRESPLAESTSMRCTYEHCDRPGESHFYKIEEGNTAGGQDWSSLVGSMLCRACYRRFKERGTLQRRQLRWGSQIPLAGSARRCTYEHCDRPDESSKFHKIEAGRTSGGRDWSSLVGSVLCYACYDRFVSRGTLARVQKRPLAASRRCTYEHCEKPDESSKFHKIEVGRTSGGRDWSSLVGRLLCNACFKRYQKRSTMERSRPVNRPQPKRKRGKQIVGSSPVIDCDESTSEEEEEEGGVEEDEEEDVEGNSQDRQVDESNAASHRLKSRDALESVEAAASSVTAMRCSYEHCDRPEKSGTFYQVSGAAGAAGQDSGFYAWLCQSCFDIVYQFASAAAVVGIVAMDSNTEPCGSKAVASAAAGDGKRLHRASKQQKPMASKAPDVGASVIGGGGRSSKGVVQAEAKCVICMEEERRMCIVPCGHFGLCGSCGETGREMGEEEKQPFCPVCRKDMRAPWAMDRAAWEEGGGAVVDA